MALPVVFATLAAGNEALALLDTQFAAVGALGIVPCTATGTNAIALAPNANTPAISAYANYLSFSFVAAATCTSAVTINVNSAGALNAYKWGGASPLVAGDIVIGSTYRATYNLALNGGAGGFAVDCIGVNNNVAVIPFIISGGGVAITTGAKGFLPVPWACTISSWSLIADQSGSITIDILRLNNAVPVTSIVGAGTKPALSAAQFAGLQTPSGWTSTALAANDWLGFTVSTVATVTQVTLALNLAKI